VHLHLHYLDEMRRVYFTRVSTQLVFVTGIKQWPLPQLVAGHVKWLFLWATWNFGNGHEIESVTVKLTSETLSLWTGVSTVSTKWDASVSTCICFLSIKGDACFQPASPISWWTARSWGPPVRTGNGLLYCPLHCGHFCKGLSEWSSLLTDQCL
jgi:hypothetical protein